MIASVVRISWTLTKYEKPNGGNVGIPNVKSDRQRLIFKARDLCSDVDDVMFIVLVDKISLRRISV